jgi:hypothetical protein
MQFYYISILFSLVLLISVTSCRKKNGSNLAASHIKVEVLNAHHSLESNKNLLLGLPMKLKYDENTGHLFIMDLDQRKVIELDDSSHIVNEFGEKGRGPGELLSVENFFLTKKHLFIVDNRQFLINKYSLRDGHYISSLDYGKFLVKIKSKSKDHIPAPKLPPFYDNNNKVHVTLKETVLLPTQADGKFLYEEINWKGKKLADIGAIPRAYTASGNENKYWSTLENKKIPARDLAEAFPVNDRSNPSDIYLVYSAIPKIAKYSLSGRKIWEHKITRMPEVDSLINNLSHRARVVRNHPKVRVAPIPIRTYVGGICSPDGNLYLITFTDPAFPKKYHLPMWIHEFNTNGKLVKRYKIGSNTDVSYYPAIDFKKHRIFVSFLHKSGIRIYHF